MENYRFERLSPTNLSHLVSLYKQCFNYKTDTDFLKLKYDTEVFGASFIGFLAFEKKSAEAAAYYGVFPVLCSLKGQKVLAAQSGDTMTHPRHQGKGLFTTLALKTYELAKQNGIHFIFGFPNSNSYPGFIKKLDWKHYADVNNYRIKTGSLPFDKLAKKIPIFNTIYQSWVLSLLKGLLVQDVIPNSLSLQNPEYGCVIHNTDYFNYKKYFPYHCISINGIKCIIKIDGRLWVGDIEYCGEEKLKQTIAAIQLLAKKLGCASVQFSLFNNSMYDLVVKEIAPLKSKNPVGFLNLTNEVNPELFAYQAFDFDTF